MSYEILGIYNSETQEHRIGGVIFSNKEVLDFDDEENQCIYFTDEEMSEIISLPEDQRLSYALELAESKRT